jgi:hypothetical protein
MVSGRSRQVVHIRVELFEVRRHGPDGPDGPAMTELAPPSRRDQA